MIRAGIAKRSTVLSPSEIAKACGGRVVRRGNSARRVSTDTRGLRRGDCFVALKGDRFNGHDYVREAVAAGATGLVVSEPLPRGALISDVFVVRVEDTGKALMDIASAYRRAHRARVVGITGSCGKTSTKDMLGHVVGGAMPTVWSPKSFNNQVGVPLTLFQLQAKTRAAVVEIGSSGPGEVERLAGVASPDIAIVTCVAEAHLDGLGSVGGVAQEKSGLVRSLSPDGVAILNGDDEACRAMADEAPGRVVMVRLGQKADWFATNPQFHGMGVTFLLQGERPVTLPLLGTHSIYNALFTIAASVELGMSIDDVLEAMGSLPPSSRRLEPKRIGDVTVFDDTYNMNPASARAGLCALSGFQGGRNKIVVFGGMAELGNRSVELHRALGEEVAKSRVDLLITVGDEAAEIAAGATAAGMAKKAVVTTDLVGEVEDLLVEKLAAGDMVLCKASRRFELDRLVDALQVRIGDRPFGAVAE